MTEQELFIIHGMGPDAVGLVGKITTPITEANGNVLDLRQDVIHGLFTIYLVVDLGKSSLESDGLNLLVQGLEKRTGLSLTAQPYNPIARRADKKNLLMTLIGEDKPGIVAASSKMLGKYNVNIEFSQTIGREGIFLMELLTDVSHAKIPIDNLQKTLRKNMEAMNIQTVFQSEDVFNKRKRVILFHIESTFLTQDTIDELIEQSDLSASDLPAPIHSGTPLCSLQSCIEKLEGLPLDVVQKLLAAITPTAGCVELLQTLKIMGYKIALASRGFSFFTDTLKETLAIDHAYGISFSEDDDARTIGPGLNAGETGAHDMDEILSDLAEQEQVDRDDIILITDSETGTPGIRLEVDLGIWLDCLNQRILSRENLAGLLGSFGLCRPTPQDES